MSLIAEEVWTADAIAAAVPLPREGRLIRLIPPMPAGEPGLLDWALAVAAAANRQIAELEARLAHLEGLSITDELTNALNRRGFMYELSRAIAAAQRGGPHGVIVMCDLDGFKAVNDRAGHAFGNETLRQVAALLMRRVRKIDAVARLGGDEFALLLSGATPTSARRKCQALAQAMAGLSPLLNGARMKLSASFGIAAFDGTEDEDTLLHRADLAMYAEKRRRARAAALPRSA